MSVKLFEDLLRIVIKTFYDDHTVVAVEHILHYSRRDEHLSNEEHKMSEDLNLPCPTIRTKLYELKKHGILVSKEGKKDTRGEEKTGNMFTRGPDQKKMVYWSFDPDLKNVIFSRILQLISSLDELVDEANRTDYICNSCKKVFTVEEQLLSRGVCDRCYNVQLVKKETNVEKAKDRKNKGIQAIKHIESRMKECLDVTLPPFFFGAIADNSRIHEKNSGARVVVPTAGAGFYTVDVVPVPEENTDKTGDDNPLRDPEVVKFFQRLERKSKKKDEPPPLQGFSVQGKIVPANEITENMQMLMTRDEFLAFYNWKVPRYDYFNYS
jgi:transcription initiation factor IIE alpha subunit